MADLGEQVEEAAPALAGEPPRARLAPGRRGLPHRLEPATAAHLVSLAAAFVLFLFLDRHQVFVGDDWEFVNRFVGTGGLQPLAPHNEHWATIPLLIYRGLFALVGLRTYLPYIAVLLLMHIATAHLLWRLLRRLHVEPWTATAIAAVLLFLGSAYEDLSWAFQIGFVGSMMFGLAGVLLADCPQPGRVRLAATWLALTAGLMTQGPAIAMVLFACLVSAARGGWRHALRVGVVPTVIYLTWFAVIGRRGASGDKPDLDSVLLLPQYVYTGLTHAVDEATGIPSLGGAAIAALAVWIVADCTGLRRRVPAALAAAVTAPALLALIGFARIAHSGGVAEAEQSRYIYLTVLLLLPLVAVLASRVAQRGRPHRLGILVLAAACVWVNVGTFRSVLHGAPGHAVQASWARVSAAAKLIQDGVPTVGRQPEPQLAGALSTDDLRRLVQDGALTPPSAPSAADTLYARAALEVSLAPDARLPMTSALPDISSVSASVSAGSDGCVVIAPGAAGDAFRMTSAGGGDTLLLTLDRDTTVSVSLTGTDGATGDAVPMPAAQGTQHLDVAEGGLILTLDLGGAVGRLCGTA